LFSLNERVVLALIEAGGLHRLTLDVDGSVVSTGMQVEGARRAYNPSVGRDDDITAQCEQRQ
jgi:alpha-tubulin suppressor-like RCC1 family protein